MPRRAGGAYLTSVFPCFNLKIPEPPFFVFTRVLKILSAVVLAPLYVRLAEAAGLSIHPPVRIGTVVGASETTANSQTDDGSDRARRSPRRSASGARELKERERERTRTRTREGALVPQTKTRWSYLPPRTLRKQPRVDEATDTVAQLRARRAPCRIVCCCALLDLGDATQPANRARALHQRSLARLFRPSVPRASRW